jgi:tRNA pseudouridine55 synthase
MECLQTMAKPTEPALDGVLLVDKPQGITSHDVVSKVRRGLGQREVGHTGTLDPMATGLMLVTLGRATRISRFLEATEKAYEGTITLGRATDTLDAEGTTTAEAEVPPIDRDRIDSVLAALTGAIDQQVPAYSAVKVDGERLYAKARRGEEVERPTRTIEVRSFECLGFDGAKIDFAVVVSKGTYVRSLAVSVGEGLGLPAHLSRLRRTRVGEFTIDRSCALEGLSRQSAVILDASAALCHLPAIRVDEKGEDDVVHGRPLLGRQLDPALPAGWARVLRDDGELLAVAELGDPAKRAADPSARALGYGCVLVTAVKLR